MYALLKFKSIILLKEFIQDARAILFGRLFQGVGIRLTRKCVNGSLPLVSSRVKKKGCLRRYDFSILFSSLQLTLSQSHIICFYDVEKVFIYTVKKLFLFTVLFISFPNKLNLVFVLNQIRNNLISVPYPNQTQRLDRN